MKRIDHRSPYRAIGSCAACVSLLSCTGADVPHNSLIADGKLQSLEVNGAELHYVANGTGPAIVFVHGGLADYRELLPVADQLKGRYTTIASGGTVFRTARILFVPTIHRLPKRMTWPR